jgi:hypothetical protein
LLKGYNISAPKTPMQQRRSENQWQSATASLCAAIISHAPAFAPARTSEIPFGAKARPKRRELEIEVWRLIGQAHAHTNAVCVLASFPFAVFPSCEGKWTVCSNASLIVSYSQQCPTELPGDRYDNTATLCSRA